MRSTDTSANDAISTDTSTNANSGTFLPAFGNRPAHIVGRSDVIADFLDGLEQPIGHRKRASILIGQRGTGKTALLLEFADLASTGDYVVTSVSSNRLMLDEIIQTIQLKGSRHIPDKKAPVKGFSAGAFGFSFGLTFTEEIEKNYGFRVKLTLLCDELAKQGKKILILVDEVQSNTQEMRDLATTYQHLVGEGKDIVIAMAGLPSSISAVLNDDILTFFNRAHKVYLGPLSLSEISVYYAGEFTKAGKSIDTTVLETAVAATRGYPYLLQLVGYYILAYSQDSEEITAAVVERAIISSKRDMVEGIFNTALRPLSQKDRAFLEAMSKDTETSRIADIRARLKVTQSYVQKYRSRLIEAGVIAPYGRGELTIIIPYLGEYLRGEF
jgi:predicted AAA+ superfamily ATPase